MYSSYPLFSVLQWGVSAWVILLICSSCITYELFNLTTNTSSFYLNIPIDPPFYQINASLLPECFILSSLHFKRPLLFTASCAFGFPPSFPPPAVSPFLTACSLSSFFPRLLFLASPATALPSCFLTRSEMYLVDAFIQSASQYQKCIQI